MLFFLLFSPRVTGNLPTTHNLIGWCSVFRRAGTLLFRLVLHQAEEITEENHDGDLADGRHVDGSPLLDLGGEVLTQAQNVSIAAHIAQPEV